MSEPNGENTGELAELLWQKQGRPLKEPDPGWLEAEYLAHPPVAAPWPSPPDTEPDLRRRGLGSFSPSDISSNMPIPLPEVKRSPILLYVLVAAGVVVATRGILSLLCKRS